ncbi:MAG: hypothetical protein SF097_04620 [Acidobacteriota bacterium]|nr:hypothetical protein [Acidobacteriota bacterium]
MAESLVIRIALQPEELSATQQKIKKTVIGAIDAVAPEARQAGRKIGDALSAGIEEGVKRARQLRQQLDSILSPTARHSAAEAAERRHNQKIEEFRERAAAQIAATEARKNAQLEAIRARSEAAEQRHQQKLLEIQQRGAERQSALSQGLIQARTALLTGLTTGLTALGAASIKSAKDIDSTVNVLRALTGSAEAAEKRFAQLVAISQKTPGLTANLAGQLDTQLRVASVRQETIDRLLPIIGRLNAIQRIEDPRRFVGNLRQIATTGDRQDLKELVEASAIGGELIKNVFGVDDPKNSKAIKEAAKRLGIETIDQFFQAFAEAGEKNEALARATESIASRFDKLRDRVAVALRPLGLTIIETISPLIEKAVPVVEKLFESFAKLPEPVRQAIVVIGGLTATVVGFIALFGTGAGEVLAVLAAIGAAAGVLYKIWQSDVGGIQAITKEVFGEASRFANEQLTTIVGFFRENLPILREAVSNVLSAIQAFWAEHGAQIKEIVRQTWEIVTTIIGAAIRNILDAIKLVAQVINGDFSGAWGTFKGIVVRSVEAVISAIGTFVSRSANIFKLIVESIFELGTKIQGAAIGIGTNLVLGIIQGIKGKVTEFYNTVKGFVQGGVDLAKRALDVRSPSRVFFDIGENVGEGFILGVQSKQAAASAAINALVTPVQLPDITGTANPLSLLVPQSFGAENIVAPAQVISDTLENVPPPIKAAADAMRQLGDATTIASQSVSPLQSAFSGLVSSAENLLSRGIDALTRKLGVFGGFVKSLLGGIAQTVLGSIEKSLAGRGGIGGFIGNLLGSGQGGGIGSFLTGGFAGGGGAASILGGSGGGGLLGSLSGLLGGGLSAPRSLSLGGLPIAPNIPIPGAAQIGGGSRAGGFSSLFGGFGGLGNLFKGIGFGKAPGSGGQLAGALPLLGISLGASLGTDRLTSILGGAAGGLLGVGLSAAPGIIGAGGALSGLGFLAPLFSNPITAIVGGAALIGTFLLGRARQRRRDEKSSGDSLQDAINQIRDVKKQVESNELTLTVSQARELFNAQILQPFIAQISQLKTKSVRESRLKNQTADLRNLFEKEVIPAVQAQKTRQGINDKLIPEFARSGIVPGIYQGFDNVHVLAHPGEMFLNRQHQEAVARIAGGDVFQRVGVPDAPMFTASGEQSFARSGIVRPSFAAPTQPQPVSIVVEQVQVFVSEEEAGKIVFMGVRTEQGQAGLATASRAARRNRLN